MKLNESKGNMYEFITHTGNIIKGACIHNCSYCYMKRWGCLKPPHFDQKEVRAATPEGNFIFVGSSTDMFARNIPAKWIIESLEYLSAYDNQYLFQSKNPMNLLNYLQYFPKQSVICTTIESNRFYPHIMQESPTPENRAKEMAEISKLGYKTYVTIEPIIDFDQKELIHLLLMCNPDQINIGADSGKNSLPEPTKEKVLLLIEEISKFTTVSNKANLKRMLQ